MMFDIYTADDLRTFRDRVNRGDVRLSARLMEDIDISGDEYWTPIGKDDTHFRGTFNGKDHTISGLHYVDPDAGGYLSDREDAALGLFEHTNSAHIKNLTVKGQLTGGDIIVGGIVGRMSGGEITNCQNYVRCSSSHITGGICGWSNRGKIGDCVNFASLKGSEAKGIVGSVSYYPSGIHTIITNCRNSGTLTVTDVPTDDFFLFSDLREIGFKYDQISNVINKTGNNKPSGKVIFPFQNTFLGMYLRRFDFYGVVQDSYYSTMYSPSNNLDKIDNTKQVIKEFIKSDPNPEHVNDKGENYLHLLCQNRSLIKVTPRYNSDLMEYIIRTLAAETNIRFADVTKRGKDAASFLIIPKNKPLEGMEPIIELINSIKQEQAAEEVEKNDETFSDIGF